MTATRYRAYRRVRRDLDVFVPASLADTEKELLTDAAEGLLLAREYDDEVEELRGRVAVALSLLVGLQRCSDDAADALWARFIACGPPSAAVDGGARIPA